MTPIRRAADYVNIRIVIFWNSWLQYNCVTYMNHSFVDCFESALSQLASSFLEQRRQMSRMEVQLRHELRLQWNGGNPLEFSIDLNR